MVNKFMKIDIFHRILGVLLLCLSLLNCTKEPASIQITSVTLNTASLSLTEGDEFLLTATITPDNATNKNVTWSSSDPSVASVVNGKVTALKAGTATITVKTEDGDKVASCSLTVKRPSAGVDVEDWGDDDKDDGGIAS